MRTRERKSLSYRAGADGLDSYAAPYTPPRVRERLGGDADMKIFTQNQVALAKQYAIDGGQALHLHRIIVDRQKAPRCFVRAVDRGEDIAHLFDQDRERLEKTAKRLGVKVLVVEHPGTPRQHIDLCGGPLRLAKQEAALFEGVPENAE